MRLEDKNPDLISLEPETQKRLSKLSSMSLSESKFFFSENQV